MNSNEQEIKAVTSGVAQADFNDMFPLVRFLARHPFELFALAITLIGVVGFAAGSSFYEGWNRAAGISNNLFPVGPYETILAGITLPKPWLYSGIVFSLLVIYVQLVELISDWGNARWGRENFLQRKRRWKIVEAARRERLSAGLKDRRFGKGNRVWSALELRNRWGKVVIPLSPKKMRQRKVIARVGGLIVAVSAMGFTWCLYVLLKAFIIDTAHAQGVQRYVGLYLSVADKLPYQIDSTLSPERAREFACEGHEVIWQYRSIELPDGHQAYIVQSTDKLFLLLDKDGSSLRSFGDTEFSFRESAKRPVSKLAQSCRQLAK